MYTFKLCVLIVVMAAFGASACTPVTHSEDFYEPISSAQTARGKSQAGSFLSQEGAETYARKLGGSTEMAYIEGRVYYRVIIDAPCHVVKRRPGYSEKVGCIAFVGGDQ